MRFAVALLLALSLHAGEILDNAAVVRMIRAGLSVDVVATKIAQSPASFDTSVDALIDLKSQGVPDPVIKAMLTKGTGQAESLSYTGVEPSVGQPLRLSPPADQTCSSVEYFTLGQHGWDWQPSLLCSGPSGIDIDEQNIAWDQVKGHCFVLSLLPKADHEWWLADGQDVYKFRAKGDELQKISDSIKRMHSSIPSGSCSDRGMAKLMAASSPRPL